MPLIESEAVSWWSWRPGIKPLRAFIFGGLLSMVALFLLLNGTVALISNILDSSAVPLRAPGIVTGHTKNALGSPQLIIHLSEPGLPGVITLVVARTTDTELANGALVTVDYAPHLHTPYALESRGHLYVLPGGSPTSNYLATLPLLLLGLLILPYPLLLSLWGWLDLRATRPRRCPATVVALRAARQSTTRTPGMVPRTTHTWYGVALQTESRSSTGEPEILTFAIREERYHTLQRGDSVQVEYSPHLRHLYTLTH
jgi:hypothetical protein